MRPPCRICIDNASPKACKLRSSCPKLKAFQATLNSIALSLYQQEQDSDSQQKVLGQIKEENNWMMPRITIISAWCNEELIAPFFLNHYNNLVDEIRILLDTDTEDLTAEILAKHPKVKVFPVTYPFGFDDMARTEFTNSQYSEISDGWVLCVDSDEFVFWNNGTIKEYLQQLPKDITAVKSNLWHPYRHISDQNLHPDILPIINQRRHGSILNDYGDCYNKPCLVEANQNLQWSVGQHVLYGADASRYSLQGVHWQMADPTIAIARHMQNGKNRMSPENLVRGFGVHCLKYDKEYIETECKKHEEDPQLF